jgi:hypothetical protein
MLPPGGARLEELDHDADFTCAEGETLGCASQSLFDFVTELALEPDSQRSGMSKNV